MPDKKYFICNSVKFRYVLALFIREGLIRKSRFALCYLNPNKASAFLEKCGVPLFFLNYDFLKMKNADGIPLLIASVKDDLYRVVENTDIDGRNSADPLLDHLDDRLYTVKDDLRAYFKQRIALDIFEDLYLVNIAHWLATEKESQLYGNDFTALIEEKSYWSSLVLDFAKSKNIKALLFRGRDLKKNKGVLFAYYFIKTCFEIMLSLFRGRSPGSLSKEAKVGIPFYLSQNFVNFLELRNYYLFWFYKSGIIPEKILIYTPDRKFSINKEEVLNIKKAGFNIVSGCTFRAASLLAGYLKQVIRMRKYAKSRFMREQWKLLSLVFVQLPYWEDFFQSNNIKVKFRFHDLFSIREIAAKISGAITISYHYSNQSDVTILHQDICDVFFVWGKKYEKSLSGEHSAIGNFVQAGYVFDYTFDNLKSRAAGLKDAFRARNVSYVIGILDEFIGGCFAQPQLKGYRAIFEYAQAHPDIGVIIKPKKEGTISHLMSCPEASGLVSKLKEQGRIVILDSRRYPTEAGQASDIVIGMIPDSTAGLECALAGAPMVIYDIFSMRSHPFYEWGYNKVIFDDIRNLLDLLNINKEKPGSIPGFSDWSPVLNTADPFRDGRANQRVGGYIKALLLKLDEGLGRDEAIKSANKAYMNEFGLDKVTPVKRMEAAVKCL